MGKEVSTLCLGMLYSLARKLFPFFIGPKCIVKFVLREGYSPEKLCTDQTNWHFISYGQKVRCILHLSNLLLTNYH